MSRVQLLNLHLHLVSGPADVDPNPPQYVVPLAQAPQLDGNGEPLGLIDCTIEEPVQHAPDEPKIYGGPPLTAWPQEEQAIYPFVFQDLQDGQWLLGLWKIDGRAPDPATGDPGDPAPHVVNAVVEQVL